MLQKIIKYYLLSIVTAFLLLITSLAGAAGPEQSNSASPPAAPKPDKTIVQINGQAIKDSDVESRFQWLIQSFGKKKLNDKQIQFYRTYTRYRLIDMLVRAEVFKQEFKKLGLSITKDDQKKQLDLIVSQTLKSHNWDMKDYKAYIAEMGISLDDKYQQLQADPSFIETLQLNKLLAKYYPNWDQFKADEIKSYYEENRESEFTEKASVRARHILFKTTDLSDEEKDKVRKQALEVLEMAKKPGANFAELAKKYSQDRSGVNGGDVGYFVRQTGRRKPGERLMLPSFTEVAFNLNINEIGPLTETPVGYHIIQVTDKKPARQFSFEESKGKIETRLWQHKRKELSDKLYESLIVKMDIKWFEKMPPKRGKTHTDQ